MEYLIIIQIVLIILLIVSVYYLNKTERRNLIYVKSDFDDKIYLVKNLGDGKDAAYILSIIHGRVHKMRDFLKNNSEKFPYFQKYIIPFCHRIKNLNLCETLPNGEYTSYTFNKGEEIGLCLRSGNNGRFHDTNLIMYVLLHELAHVACPEMDHTELFKKIFIFFLKIAVYLEIYENVNYQINPHEYCGITINENLLDN